MSKFVIAAARNGRLRAAASAQAGEKLWLIFVRLAEAPLFLVFWGTQAWGEWLLLTAVAQYLQLTKLGIGAAGQNQAVMASAAGDDGRALATLHTVHAGLWVLSVTGLALVLIPLFFVDPGQLLGLSLINGPVVTVVIISVLLQVILKLHIAVPFAALASVGRYPLAYQFHLGLVVLDFLPVVILLPLGFGPATVAACVTAMTFIGYVAFWLAAVRIVPWFQFGARYASWAMFERLWRPSLGMFAFNLGTVLNVQGFRIAAGLALGPATLAWLVVLRTFGQTLVQVAMIFTLSFRPELSAAHGRGDDAEFRRLSRKSTQLALWVVMPLALLGLLGGQWVIFIWTGGRVHASFGGLVLVLAAGVLESMWRNAMSPAIAVNRHNRVSLVYVLVYGALSVALTVPLAEAFGEHGALLAVLVAQTLMAAAVFRMALPLSGESDRLDWLRAVIAPPLDVFAPLLRRRA